MFLLSLFLFSFSLYIEYIIYLFKKKFNFELKNDMKEKTCETCRRCTWLGSLPKLLEPFVCRCSLNNGLVSMDNSCSYYEKTDLSCEGCVHFMSSGIGSFCELSKETGVRCCEGVGS